MGKKRRKKLHDEVHMMVHNEMHGILPQLIANVGIMRASAISEKTLHKQCAKSLGHEEIPEILKRGWVSHHWSTMLKSRPDLYIRFHVEGPSRHDRSIVWLRAPGSPAVHNKKAEACEEFVFKGWCSHGVACSSRHDPADWLTHSPGHSAMRMAIGLARRRAAVAPTASTSCLLVALPKKLPKKRKKVEQLMPGEEQAAPGEREKESWVDGCTGMGQTDTNDSHDQQCEQWASSKGFSLTNEGWLTKILVNRHGPDCCPPSSPRHPPGSLELSPLGSHEI